MGIGVRWITNAGAATVRINDQRLRTGDAETSTERAERTGGNVTEQEIWELVGERLERLSRQPSTSCAIRLRPGAAAVRRALSGTGQPARVSRRFPDPPIIQPRRLVGADDLWVVEAVRSDQSSRIFVVAILEFRDGRIWRDTRWFGDPLEAPAWRAGWVERFEEPSPGAG